MPIVPLYAVNNETVFDPGTLSLTGWWRANYSASPWTGTASAGTSGSHDLSEATNPPTTGTTVNGFTPARFNGTNQILNAGTTVPNFIGLNKVSGWAVGKVTDVSSPRAFWINLPGITVYPRCFNNAGSPIFKFSLNNDAVGSPVSTAFTLSAWQLFTWRYDGANSQCGVNAAPGSAGGGSTSAYSTNLTQPSETPIVGRSNGSTFYVQDMLEVAITNIALTDQNFADIKSYVNARYGLSL
jgi:hypothetical protein